MRSPAVLVLVGLLASSAMAQTVEKMGIWAPLYVLPRITSDSKDEYNRLIDSVEGNKCLKDSFHGTVLTGPNSGPPSEKDHDFFAERFNVVGDTKQWTAFGYVTTAYGARDLEAVKKDIAVWLDTDKKRGFGDIVQGIWVDNVRNDIDTKTTTEKGKKMVEYYAEIAKMIRSYGKIVAFNPGTNFNDCEFLAKYEVAFVNNFEDTYAKWAELDLKDKTIDCPCKTQTRCIASIHQYPALDKNKKPITQNEVQATMRRMSTRGYSAMFITEREMPNHYLQLPSIWPLSLEAACNTNIGQGQMDDASQKKLVSREDKKKEVETDQSEIDRLIKELEAKVQEMQAVRDAEKDPKKQKALDAEIQKEIEVRKNEINIKQQELDAKRKELESLPVAEEQAAAEQAAAVEKTAARKLLWSA